jgi:hypothetical protein
MKIAATTELKKGDILTVEDRKYGMVIAIVKEDSKYNLELFIPAFNQVKHEFFMKCGSQERFLNDNGYTTSPEWLEKFKAAIK